MQLVQRGWAAHEQRLEEVPAGHQGAALLGVGSQDFQKPLETAGRGKALGPLPPAHDAPAGAAPPGHLFQRQATPQTQRVEQG
jgi:hypothetical protein